MNHPAIIEAIEFAWIETNGNSRLDHEEEIVSDYLKTQGIEVRLFTRKQINRRVLPINNRTPVIGGIPSVRGALRQLGVDPPPPNDYPASLQMFLHRQVKKSTVGELRNRIESGSIFVKPASVLKKFTGRVILGYEDLYLPPTVSHRTEVWISEVVEWISEYRAYVIDGDIVDIRHYYGDPNVEVDVSEVKDAVRRFTDSPKAYAIDFGVLSTGQTALIEANDGYSVGAYGIDGETYTRFLLTRWAELTAISSIK